jgi:hypothetical protein
MDIGAGAGTASMIALVVIATLPRILAHRLSQKRLSISCAM